MTSDAAALADRLLDAQVAFLVAELTSAQTEELVAAEALALVAAVQDVPLGQFLDRAALQATVAEGLDHVGPSPAVDVAATTLVGVLQELPANDEHDLGEVVDRAAVATIVDVLVASDTLRTELLRRLSTSPAVSALAMRFVSALVGDTIQQNRERAEKMPGAKSLLGVADFAARSARGMAPKQLEKAVGSAADKSAQAAMESVSRALVDAFDEDAMRRAAMEVWDAHGDDRVAGLRSYLDPVEVEGVTAGGLAAWSALHDAPWFRAVVAAAVDAFLDRYEDVPIGALLGDFGLSDATIAAMVSRHAPRLVETLHRHDQLEPLLRRRLEPFFRSDAALTLLGDA